ncbi:MAG: hypothetical protein ACRD12_05710 [Acidimicrobiales bacterium]
MSTIEVTPHGSHRHEVTVTGDGTTTSHQVTVPDGLLEQWGLTDADEETVVRESFAFLLEREPATSIMSEFSLSVISRYFPEYGDELPRRLTER